MMHMWKIIEKFQKRTEEDIAIATTMALQEWSGKAVELLVLRVDKANWDLKGPRFSKLDKANTEAMQSN